MNKTILRNAIILVIASPPLRETESNWVGVLGWAFEIGTLSGWMGAVKEIPAHISGGSESRRREDNRWH
jgi:hypothetical protein